MLIFIQYCKSIIRKCLIRYKIIIVMPKVITYFARFNTIQIRMLKNVIYIDFTS